MIQRKIKLKKKSNKYKGFKVHKRYCKRCGQLKVMNGNTGKICQDCNLTIKRDYDWLRNRTASKS